MLLTSCSRWTVWFWISPVYSCWHVQCGDVQLCGDIQLCGYMFSVVTPAIMCWLVRVVILWWDVVTQGWQFVIILRVCWHVQCGDLCNAVVRCGCPVLAVCNFMSRKCGDMFNVVTCAMWWDVNAQCWQFVIILRVERVWWHVQCGDLCNDVVKCGWPVLAVCHYSKSRKNVVTCSMWWPVQWCREMRMPSIGSLVLFWDQQVRKGQGKSNWKIVYVSHWSVRVCVLVRGTK